MNEWISTKDKYPEFHQDVLFYVDEQLGVMTGMLYRGSHKFKAYDKLTEAAFYKSDVSHWMPLPKPPK